MENGLTGIIFDLDGTLYDNSGIGGRFISRSLFSLNYLTTSRKVRHAFKGAFHGSGEQFFRFYYQEFARRMKTDPDRVARWEKTSFYPAFFSILKKYYKQRPGIESLISALNVPAAVLSDYEYVDERLKVLGIDPSLFTLRASSGEIGGLKPCREVFLRTAESMGAAPSGCLVVGDREDTDGAGAENAGMDFFLVNEHTWSSLPEYLGQ